MKIATTLVLSAGLMFGIPLAQAQEPVQSGVESGSQEQNRVDTEMMSHQRAMEIVLAWLQQDFPDVAKSKDGIGDVRDKATVKAYKRDLDALRVIASQHRQFATDYERWCSGSFSTDYVHWCGPDVKENEMAGHQQRMKEILIDLSTTFDNYIKADDHGIDQSHMIERTLHAHRDALNELADAIKDHEQAAAQMTVNGAHHSNAQSGPVPPVSIPVLPLAASSHASLPATR